MKAYKHLVKYALNNNCVVSVWDGEEWQVGKSSAYKSIIDAIESVEQAELKIYSKFDTRGEGYKGWALVSAFGLEDDETVIDNTVTEFMNNWEETYNQTV
jgi:hypothetical protein